MKIERVKNAKRNMIFGVILRIYQLLVPFVVRTIMIYYMGVEYIGLGSLFTSILEVLSLTELGVGSALVFSMYKPIAEDNKERICALMRLYRTYYRAIGTIILVVGIAITPIVPKLVKGDVPENISLMVLYYLNLGATVLSYFLFAYKNSLLSAHQRTDIPSKLSIIISTLKYGLQIGAIFIGNYYLYTMVALFTAALTNIITSLIVDKMYPEYKAIGKLPKEEVKFINRRIKDLFTSKVGFMIINSADTIVISAFLGLQVLAIYNNYYYIVSSLFGFIGIIFSSCTAGIGNSLIIETQEKNYNDFKKFLLIIVWITGVCTCCLMCLFQPFIKLWVGEELMLSMDLVVCFCVYFFIYEINRLMNNYKDAAGIWHEDRFRPLIEALTNLCLNLIMVKYIGLFGILLSTILSMVVVGMPWLTYNLFTEIFKRSAKEFIIDLFKYMLITAISSVVCYWGCSYINIEGIFGLLLKGFVVMLLANGIYFICFCKTKEFSEVKKLALKLVGR